MALYCLRFATPNQVYVFPEDTANDGTATASRVFNLPTGVGSARGIVIDGDNLYIADASGAEAYVVPANTANNGTATTTRRFNLPTDLTVPRGMTIDGNDLYIADDTGDEVFVVPANTANNGTATTTRRFNLPTGLTVPQGMVIDGNDLYIVDFDGDEVYVVPANTGTPYDPDDIQTATTTRRFNLPTDLTNPVGMTIDGNNLYIADDTGDEVFVVPANTANNGTATTTRRFNLPTGLTVPNGLTFTPSQATVTISTTDTDIRAGEVFNVDIDFSADVTDFVASDITVTGGTRGTLSGSGTAYDLSVTAGSAGTLTVSLNEDVVTPGNVAASQDFTVNAIATVGIAFDDSTLENDASTTARIVFSEAVTGLTLSDFSVNVGTVTNLVEVATNSYTVTVTAPSSGSGTLTLTLQANAVDQRNLVETESLTYTPPADAVLSMSVSAASVLTGVSPVVTFSFDKAVTGFTGADVTVSTGAIKRTLTDNGDNSYSMPVTAPATGDGTVTVSVGADVVSPGNNADSVTFDYAYPTIALLHIADGDDDNIRVIATDSATVLRTYTIPNSDDMQSLVFDGTHFHVANWNTETIRVFGSDTVDGSAATVLRSYTVSGIAQPSGMAFDGTNIHISDRGDDNIRVIAPDTADNASATILRTYEVPLADDIRGMTFDGTNIHAADYTDDNIRTFAPDTADGAEATVLLTYTVTGLNHCRAMVFDGTNIHLADVDDDNFRVIAVPTTNGTQTVLRTYTVSGLEFPRGMAHVLPPPTQATLTITTTDTDIREGENVFFSITSDLDITDFTLSDITLTGATAVAFSEITANSYQLQATAGTGAGSIVVSVAENAVSPGNFAASETFTRNAHPTVAISSSDANIYEGESFTVTLQWSEAVTGFEPGDITVTGATRDSYVAVSFTTYTIGLTAAADAGDIVVTVAANAVGEGNVETAETFTRSAYPTATITTTDTAIYEGESVSFDIVFSESVTNFVATDVTVTGGTRGALTGSGTTYALQVTADSGGGTIALAIAENAVSPFNDAVNASFTRLAYPSITISTTDTDIREREAVDFDIVFTEAVTGFTDTDITVTGGTRGTLTGSGTDYVLSVTADAGAGNIVITIAAGVVMPGNQAATQTFTRNALDAVDISTTETDIREGETFTVNITFPIDVTGFAASDITITGGTLGTLAGSGMAYTIPVTAASGAGPIVISIGQDVVNEGNAAATATFTRLSLPTITITSDDPDIQENETFNVNIVFSEAVTMFVVGDITVTGASINGLTGSGADYDLSLTADAGTGNIVIVIAVNVVMPGNAATTATFTRSELPPMPPVWQTGVALVVNIASGADLTVDVGALVSGETSVSLVSTLETWMAWNDTTDTLTLTSAPSFSVDTEFRVEFSATNTDGTVTAFLRVIVNASKLATLHSSLFFKVPISDSNRITQHGTTTAISEMNDNNYRTFSTVLDVDIDTRDAAGNVTGIDYVFVKAKGTDIQYSFTPSGGVGTGFTDRTIPTTITNHEGTDVSTVVSDFVHELYPLPASVTASSVRLQFSGTNVQIYDIMILELLAEVQANSRYTSISFSKVDRSGVLQQSNGGQVRRQPAIGNTRLKWTGNYTCIFAEHSVPEFMHLIENNLNISFAMEFSRHPARVFRATFPALRFANGYLGVVRSAGETVEFQVAEQ